MMDIRSFLLHFATNFSTYMTWPLTKDLGYPWLMPNCLANTVDGYLSFWSVHLSHHPTPLWALLKVYIRMWKPLTVNFLLLKVSWLLFSLPDLATQGNSKVVSGTHYQKQPKCCPCRCHSLFSCQSELFICLGHTIDRRLRVLGQVTSGKFDKSIDVTKIISFLKSQKSSN